MLRILKHIADQATHPLSRSSYYLASTYDNRSKTDPTSSVVAM